VNKRIEIKGFMSDGPCSFGPEERWDWIYFVDCKNCLEKQFSVYEIKLSNKSDKWRNIIVSGTEFDNTNIPDIPNDMNNMKVSELKKLCEARGLSQSGSKIVLINKIKTQEPGSKFGKLKLMGQLCDTGRGGTRPHICFEKIKQQLDKDIKMIWSGDINLI
jgi:hypothetical protein